MRESRRKTNCIACLLLIPGSYPPKMIPGCHITVQTDATNNRDARLLLQSIGIPFYGKLND